MPLRRVAVALITSPQRVLCNCRQVPLCLRAKADHMWSRRPLDEAHRKRTMHLCLLSAKALYHIVKRRHAPAPALAPFATSAPARPIDAKLHPNLFHPADDLTRFTSRAEETTAASSLHRVRTAK